MNGLDVGDLGGADDSRDLEVTLRGWCRADADGLIGQCEIGCASICLAEHCHDFDTEILAGTNYPQSDLTSIGDQNALEHVLTIRWRRWVEFRLSPSQRRAAKQ